MAVGGGEFGDRFWLERAATATGFDALGARMFGRDRPDGDVGYGPYLLVTVLATIDVLILPALGYVQTGSFITLENPGDLVILPTWLLVTWSILKLKRRYHETVAELDDLPETDEEVDVSGTDSRGRVQPIVGLLFPDQDGQSFDPIFPTRQKVLLLLLGWAYHVSWFLTDPTAGDYVVATSGELVAALKFGVVYPLFYYPIGVEFLTLFLSIHLLLPYRITQQNRIDFSDPHGFGGLRPVGNLARSSAVHYLLLLSLYVGFVSLAKGVTTGEAAHMTLIVAGTAIGIVLFFVPVLWVGFHMQSLKHAKINAIAERVEELGSDDHAFPETRAESTSDASVYTHEYARLSVVKEMNDYPVDIFAVRDFVYALPAPFIINLVTTYVTNNVLTI